MWKPSLRLAVALRLSNSLAEQLEHPVGNLRVFLEKGLEAPFRDGRERDIRVRLDVGAAALVVQQGHLPERVPGAELARLALDGRDGHRAVQDDHESNTVFAF